MKKLAHLVLAVGFAFVAWLLVVFVLGGLALLVWFLPVVAGVVFVACVALAAVLTGRIHGFWSGVRLFIKEILFGW